MEFFQTKIQKIRDNYDSRFLVLAALALIGLSFVWNGAKVIQQNYVLLQRIAVLEEENRILEIENKNKQIQNVFYESPTYAELKVRRVNGKAAPGERVYVITDEVAKRAVKTSDTKTQEETEDTKPSYQRNFEAWMEFFFGGTRD